MRFQKERAREWVPGADDTAVVRRLAVAEQTVTHPEVATLQRIVEALDSVFYGNVDTMTGEHLNRLSQARAEAAFLLERKRRQAGREVLAA